jgi:hypothetical protein
MYTSGNVVNINAVTARPEYIHELALPSHPPHVNIGNVCHVPTFPFLSSLTQPSWPLPCSSIKRAIQRSYPQGNINRVVMSDR